jgi:hypothetical protein
MATIEQPQRNASSEEWQVYADALQEAGDPRGELIALNHNETARDAFVEQHAVALLGAAMAKRLSAYRLRWHHCLLDEVEIRLDHHDGREYIEALFSSPAASELQALALVGVSRVWIDISSAVAKIVELGLPPSCKQISLVDHRALTTTFMVSRDFDPDRNLVGFGPVGRLLSLPTLERFRLVTADPMQTDFSGIDAPNLHSFILHGLRYGEPDHTPTPLSQQLAAARWPKLREFEVRLCETAGANLPNDVGAYVEVYSREGDDEDYYADPEEADYYGYVDWSGELAGLLQNLKRRRWKG